MMDRVARSLIVGTLLGDGCLTVQKGGHAGRHPSALLLVRHSIKQHDYAQWLCNEIADKIGAERRLVAKDWTVADGKRYQRVNFRFGHPYFRILRKWMYREDGKHLDKVVRFVTTPEGLAVWFMDDGYCPKSGGFHLSTYCFSEEENYLAAEHLEGAFGVLCRVSGEKHRGQTRFCLVANPDEGQLLWEVIGPEIPSVSSMDDKFANARAYYGDTVCLNSARRLSVMAGRVADIQHIETVGAQELITEALPTVSKYDRLGPQRDFSVN